MNADFIIDYIDKSVNFFLAVFIYLQSRKIIFLILKTMKTNAFDQNMF